jgi:Uncharacterized protein involved in response to NO
MNEIKSPRHNPISALLAHPFRPFFLITGIYAVAVMVGWIAFLFGGMPIPVGWAPVQWHSHEMLYGFVTAATAGFVLTAMTNWTGAQPLQGHKLLALLLLWLVGRLAMWFGGWLPDLLVAVLDLAFLPVLGIYVAWVLIAHNNRRNFILVAVLALLFAGNLMMQIGLITQKIGLLYLGQQHGINVITLLMVIIAGRIIPAFSRNWLRLHGDNPEAVKTFRILEIFSIGSVVLLLVADWFPLPIQVKGVLALLAAAANGLRLVGWVGWKTTREPLLWILHLAYLWVAVALLLRGIAGFTPVISASVWQHAMSVGGMATLILGVMTRVTMGHTGRPLKLLRFALLAYIAIILATVLRLLAATGALDFRLGVSLSALAWIVAFGLFVVLYGPALMSPRADGKPG